MDWNIYWYVICIFRRPISQTLKTSLLIKYSRNSPGSREDVISRTRTIVKSHTDDKRRSEFKNLIIEGNSFNIYIFFSYKFFSRNVVYALCFLLQSEGIKYLMTLWFCKSFFYYYILCTWHILPQNLTVL